MNDVNFDETTLAVNLLETNYTEMMKKMYDFKDLDEYEIYDIIFPYEWAEIVDNDVKIRALRDALREKIKLIETEELAKYFRSL